MKIVLQKFIAESGYSSRHKAEELIRARKVKVNGKIAELGMRVDNEDEVIINGKRIKAVEDKLYIALNKPKGYVCTTRKFEGEKNVFDLISKSPQPPFTKGGNLFIAGRLDKESRGLVILTNDGEFAQKIAHPRFEHEKEYEVLVQSRKSKVERVEDEFKKGIDIGEEDGIVRAKKVKFLGFDKEKKILKYSIILTEGKKRQIRRMFKALGFNVVDLVRVRIGKIKLNDLQEGKWKYLDKKSFIK